MAQTGRARRIALEEIGDALTVLGFQQRPGAKSESFFVYRGREGDLAQFAMQRTGFHQRLEGRKRADQARFHIERAQAVQLAITFHRFK